MENKNKGNLKLIVLGVIVLLMIILLLTFCSKKPKSDESSYSEAKGINKPLLVEGMKAIKFENNEWVEISDPNTDTSWYDYKKKENNEWANAITSDGSMWVWIPRYAYKINKDNNTIDIVFLQNKTNKDGDLKEISSNYTVHPSFIDNVYLGGWDSHISGFWVSKFEAGKEDNKLTFKPNVYSYNNITIGESYTMCKNLSYSNIDPHMIKSSEWGAVAYLAHSIYGRNGIEVTFNNTKAVISEEDITSVTAGGNGINGLATSEIEALKKNANQSTTGNVYGVYDMAGGLWERVSAYINNGNENLLKNGKSLLEDGNADESNKYKTVYEHSKDDDDNETNYNVNKNIIGDAIFETSNGIGNGEQSWFNDYSSFMTGNSVFLHRGGTTTNTLGVGIFAFSNTPGQAYRSLGFRCTLVNE
jgi:hypothetical protein